MIPTLLDEVKYTEAHATFIMDYPTLIGIIVHMADKSDVDKVITVGLKFPLYYQAMFFRELYRKFYREVGGNKVFVTWFNKHVSIFDAVTNAVYDEADEVP